MFNNFKIKVVVFLMIIVSLVSLKYFLLEYPISEKVHQGHIQEINLEGTIFKTYEGSLLTKNSNSTKPEEIKFSVKNEKIFQEIKASTAQLVEVTFEKYYFNFPRNSPITLVAWKVLEEKAGSEKVILTPPEAHTLSVDGSLSESNLGINSNQLESNSATQININKELTAEIQATLFCSFLGSLYQDKELFFKVKNYMKSANLYLYAQYARCKDKF